MLDNVATEDKEKKTRMCSTLHLFNKTVLYLFHVFSKAPFLTDCLKLYGDVLPEPYFCTQHNIQYTILIYNIIYMI